MTTGPTSQSPESAGLSNHRLDTTVKNFASLFTKSSPKFDNPIPMRLITYLHGESQIILEEDEVLQMIQQENLQYTVIKSFSYGMQRSRNLEGLSLHNTS